MRSREAPSVRRRYGSYLYALNRIDGHLVQSETIGRLLGMNATQVRRDLSRLGSHGKRGTGYPRTRLAQLFRPARARIGVYGDMDGIGAVVDSVANFPHLTLASMSTPDVAVLMFKDEAVASLNLAGLRDEGVAWFVNLGDYLLYADEVTVDNAAPLHAICRIVGEAAL